MQSVVWSTVGPMSGPRQALPTERASSDEVQDKLDQISLEQALIDFELANERVVDLTKRLISANEGLAAARAELWERTEELHALQHVHTAMQQSTAFRIATKIWTARNLLKW